MLGLLVAVGAWLAGPGAAAARIRATVTGRERRHEPGPFATWVGHAKNGLRFVIITLGAIALVAVSQPSGLTVLVIATLVLVALAVLELVGRPGRAPETPTETETP